jgi:hypothetical protein
MKLLYHVLSNIASVFAQSEGGKTVVEGSNRFIHNMEIGKVFCLPESKQSKIQGDYSVQRQYEEEGVSMVKILSGTPQNLPSAAPSVEEGYLWALKGN